MEKEVQKGKIERIRIEKLTINMGVGEPGEKLDKAFEVLKEITGKKPVKTKAKIREAKWNIRPGLEIGVKVTLRRRDAEEFLKRVFKAKDNKVRGKSFDSFGNLSLGIEEHIDLPGTKYNPKLGIYGMDVSVSFRKPGYRISKRKLKRGKIGKKQRTTKGEAISFLRERFGVEIV